jgi:hypothetical protein
MDARREDVELYRSRATASITGNVKDLRPKAISADLVEPRAVLM